MANMKTWLQNHIPSRRRLIQLYAALLYNAHLKGFGEGTIYTGAVKSVCVPGLNCYSCPGAVGACPLGALQNALASTSTRTPYYVLGILLLFGLTLGRVVCGFLCPVGLLQELLHKLPVPKIKKGKITRALSFVKYVILAVFVLIIPLYYALRHVPLPAFCKYICPAGTLEGAVGLLLHPGNADAFSMLGALFTNKFVILILLLTASAFLYRVFCRFLCPLGAIYGLFSRISLLGVTVDAGQCTRCGVCKAHCPVDIRSVGDHECIQCGRCVQTCPHRAISWKKPIKRIIVKPWLAGCAALALLAGALICFNRPVQAPAAPIPVESDLPVGGEVGMQCPDFTVDVYQGSPFTLSAQQGKVTVINFWATWCTPCIGELPYFDQLRADYPEQVSIIALHSSLVTEDWQAYADSLPYGLSFALDADGSILSSLGGSVMLPQTVIVDRDGKIVYNQPGSVTYEKLQALIAPLLAEE